MLIRIYCPEKKSPFKILLKTNMKEMTKIEKLGFDNTIEIIVSDKLSVDAWNDGVKICWEGEYWHVITYLHISYVLTTKTNRKYIIV